jgi:hypothetical protein
MKTVLVLVLRAAGYLWAAPCTLLGLLVALPWLGAGARARCVDGVLEVAFSGYPLQQRWVHRLPFSAMTLGHVVLGVSHGELARLRAHEHAHVRQYERWGILFFPAYGLSSVQQFACGRGLYWNNRFEVQARAQAARRGQEAPGWDRDRV